MELKGYVATALIAATVGVFAGNATRPTIHQVQDFDGNGIQDIVMEAPSGSKKILFGDQNNGETRYMSAYEISQLHPCQAHEYYNLENELNGREQIEQNLTNCFGQGGGK